MAVGDAHLRASGRSFAELLGVVGTSVTPGAVVGIPGSSSELLVAVEGLADSGYARVKVKISPDTGLATRGVVRRVLAQAGCMEWSANAATRAGRSMPRRLTAICWWRRNAVRTTNLPANWRWRTGRDKGSLPSSRCSDTHSVAEP